MRLLSLATLKFRAFWCSRTLTFMQETGASALHLSPFFIHYLSRSDGKTALRLAVEASKGDVAKYLRSIHAPDISGW